jgi:hypothetical protein
MGITEDASTPAVLLVNNISSASITTASFSPPAGSYCIAMCGYTGNSVFQSTPTLKVTDSKGNTWNQGTILQESSGIAVVQIFTQYFTTAPGSITVTLAQTANIHTGADNNMAMAVRVLNGAASNQSGAGTSNSRHVPPYADFYWTNSVTEIGSLVYQVVSYLYANVGWSNAVVNSNTTTIADEQNVANQQGTIFGVSTNATASLTDYTMGWILQGGDTTCGFAGINLEILPATASNVTVNLQCAKVNVKAISPTVQIGSSTVVNLQTAQVNVAAYPPTISTVSAVSGGFGAPGNIKVTYLSPLVEALAYSISPIAGTDGFGNQLPVGYQGPISAIQPGSMPTVTETWHTLSLVGANCSASGNGVNGFFYRYTSDNEVELVWDLALTGSGTTLATLPSAYTPIITQNIITSWYGTGPAAYDDLFSPHLQVSNTGVIMVNGIRSTAIGIAGREKFTLDNI